MYVGIMAKRLTLRLPEDMYTLLVEDSKKTGNPVSSTIRVAISMYLLDEEK